ncbi:hypothetical protein F5884DRAFT_445484 [Xylogone sp. PMI_703]|nr:hypothetical protein F5884DRAFT_445484 [Xylogone sp. PMI_703]
MLVCCGFSQWRAWVSKYQRQPETGLRRSPSNDRVFGSVNLIRNGTIPHYSQYKCSESFDEDHGTIPNLHCECNDHIDRTIRYSIYQSPIGFQNMQGQSLYQLAEPTLVQKKKLKSGSKITYKQYLMLRVLWDKYRTITSFDPKPTMMRRFESRRITLPRQP